MRFRIVKLKDFSDDRASIYSVILNDDNETLFDYFMLEYHDSFKSELLDIISRIRTIGSKTGAREHFFKPNEGKPGDGVCALYYSPTWGYSCNVLHMCLWILILGGGGEKLKNIRRLQDNEKLKEENYLLREISKAIYEKTRNGEIRLSKDDNDFIGNLEFDTDEEA